MICRQCEESVNGTGCTKNGVCGKNAELADRQDVLVGVLMDISTSYGKGVDSESATGIDALIVDGLFSTLTNTNFDIESINSENRTHFQLSGISNGFSSSEISGSGFSFLIFPALISFCFSCWIC